MVLICIYLLAFVMEHFFQVSVNHLCLLFKNILVCMYSLIYICTIFVQCPQKQERNSLDLLLVMLVMLLMRALGPEPVSFPEQKVLLAEPSALVPFTSTFEKYLCIRFVHFIRIFLFWILIIRRMVHRYFLPPFGFIVCALRVLSKIHLSKTIN